MGKHPGAGSLTIVASPLAQLSSVIQANVWTMKTSLLKFLLPFCLLIFFAIKSKAQVIVDEKDISTDKDLTYIQFLYYIEKSTFRPVYLIDHGLVDSQQVPQKKQKLSINKVEIKDSMSPMYVLNLLAKSGWEYMGDETYVQVPMMEGWYSFTLKRKK
jgi:hypothetical protein